MKRSILSLTRNMVFIVIFNIIFFTIGGTKHPPSVWINYAFIHFAYLMLLIVPFITEYNCSAIVLRSTIYTISAIYFVVEFIIGMIFILGASFSVTLSCVIHIIITGIFAIILITFLLANEETQETLKSPAGSQYITDEGSSFCDRYC